MIRLLACWLTVIIAYLLATVPSPASAHDDGQFYGGGKWPSNATEHWVFDNNVPSGDFRESVRFGVGQWDNGAGGNGPNFIFDGETTASIDWDPCSGLRSKVFVHEDLGSALGLASEAALGYTPACYNCGSTGCVITRFLIVLEKTAEAADAVGWYTGSGSPNSNEWDLRSTATHESGHATGWVGHFSSADMCPGGEQSPNPAGWHTMCSGAPGLEGTTMRRSLEPHDLHTYDNAY